MEIPADQNLLIVLHFTVNSFRNAVSHLRPSNAIRNDPSSEIRTIESRAEGDSPENDDSPDVRSKKVATATANPEIPKDNWLNSFGISCSECDERFSSKPRFIEHFKLTHPDSDLIFTCSCCRKRYGLDNYSGFRSHCHRHFLTRKTKFSESSDSTERKEDHPKVIEKIPEPGSTDAGSNNGANAWISRCGILCKLCDTKFFEKATYDRHFKDSHSDRSLSYACTSCDYACQEYSKFRNHCYRHIANTKYKCPFCSKFYYHQTNLSLHIDNKHLDKKNFSCQYCNKKFFTSKGLKTHGEKNHTNFIIKYECSHCAKILSNKSSLDSHMKGFHTGTVRFFCPTCGLQFTQKSNLKEHMIRHEDEPTHGCSRCPATFKTRNDLKRHLHQVHSDKCYECKICNKVYKTGNHLREHMQSHAESKMHKCSECNKGFTTNYRLEQHLNTHIGLKPHRCQYCQASYAHRSNLLKHFKKTKHPSVYPNMSVINATENVKPSVIADCGNNVKNDVFRDKSEIIRSDGNNFIQVICDNPVYDSEMISDSDRDNLTKFIENQHHTMSQLPLQPGISNTFTKEIIMSSVNDKIVPNNGESHSKIFATNPACNTNYDKYMITNNNDETAVDCNPSTSVVPLETDNCNLQPTDARSCDTTSTLDDRMIDLMDLEELNFILDQTDLDFNFDGFAELNSFFEENPSEDANVIVGF